MSLSHSAVLHYIGSSNGLVPSGNSLPEPMMTDLCRHMASLGHNELKLLVPPGLELSRQVIWCSQDLEG